MRIIFKRVSSVLVHRFSPSSYTNLGLEAVLLVDRVLDLLLEAVGQVHVVEPTGHPAIAGLLVAIGRRPLVAGVDAVIEAEMSRTHDNSSAPGVSSFVLTCNLSPLHP